MTSWPGRVVIVGASAAGLTTAEALRRNGYDGQVTLIGDEPHLPYDRPPLSKQVLAGTWEPERIALTHDVRCQRAGLDLRLGTTATGVDVRARTVTLACGERLRYDKLVIATGVKPSQLPGVRPLSGVHVLRTVDDALALRADLLRAHRIAVVGAGFLGCEVAATARGLGLDVTLIDPLPAPMTRQLGARVGRLVSALHSDHGVRLRTGLGVSELLGDESVTGLALTDGTVIGAEVVLVAVGSSPAIQWLTGSSVPIGDGILCDSTCQAAPNVYAVPKACTINGKKSEEEMGFGDLAKEWAFWGGAVGCGAGFVVGLAAAGVGAIAGCGLGAGIGAGFGITGAALYWAGRELGKKTAHWWD